MLSCDPAWHAALLTIEQTAPSFAEAMAFIESRRKAHQREPVTSPPPKPIPEPVQRIPVRSEVRYSVAIPHDGAAPIIEVLPVAVKRPKPIVRAKTDGSVLLGMKTDEHGNRVVTKAVKVRPLLFRRERPPEKQEPAPEVIEDACREIRANWSFNQQVSRQASLDADMRRVARWWSGVGGRFDG